MQREKWGQAELVFSAVARMMPKERLPFHFSIQETPGPISFDPPNDQAD